MINPIAANQESMAEFLKYLDINDLYNLFYSRNFDQGLSTLQSPSNTDLSRDELIRIGVLFEHL